MNLVIGWQSCVVAVVVPEVDVVKSWAVENGIPGTLSVLCANPDVKNLIMTDMINWGKEAGLKSFEQVTYPHFSRKNLPKLLRSPAGTRRGFQT